MEITLFSGEFGKFIKLQDVQIQSFKFQQLKESIETNLGVHQAVILDERGIDISSMHADDTVIQTCNLISNVQLDATQQPQQSSKDLKKQQNSLFYIFNEQLQNQSEILKFFEEKYGSKNDDLKNVTISNGLIGHDIDERFNFKPIYAASSYIGGLDVTSIQNFEQTFFNDYSQLKQSFKRFKHRTSMGFKLLKDIENQAVSLDLLKKSQTKTVDHLFNHSKNTMKKRLTERLDTNKQILKNYDDAISELKKFEVHSVLRKDGKQTLMDFYYDEAAMNRWRDSCKRTEESLRNRIDKFDKEISAAKLKYQTVQMSPGQSTDDQLSKELFKGLESIISEKEPLIISILSTIYENLKEIHKHLNVFCAVDPKKEDIKNAQTFFSNLEQLKLKAKSHQDLSHQMEEHSIELEKLIAELKELQLKNAYKINSTVTKQSSARKEFKSSGANIEALKAINDSLLRTDKDFQYLLHPSKLPRAYDKSIIEVARRRKFRRTLDQEYARIKQAINKDKEIRNQFMNDYGRLLPAEFIPQLREVTPIIRLEGGMKDYELPEITEDVATSDYDCFQDDKQSNGGKVDPEIVQKYNELIKEQHLLKEEHKSNVAQLNNKLEEFELQIKLKNDKIVDLQKTITQREAENSKQRLDIEKLMKNLKDMSLAFSVGQKMNEETIARKSKEVESLLREKKCKNCILCLDDIKDRSADSSIVAELSDKLKAKSQRIDQLEEQLRKSTGLVNQVSQQNFQFLRQKTCDFYKQIESIKSGYETRLMEVEEKLTLEQKRCETVIKTRVAVLEEKCLKSKNKEAELQKKLKDAVLSKESNEKEIKILRDKAKQTQIDTNKAQGLLNNKIQHLEDEAKADKKRLEETNSKQLRDCQEQIGRLQKQVEQLTEDKSRFEEKVKRENQILVRQLNELKEQSEREIREKNENILRLNNILNENIEKSSETNSHSIKLMQEQIDKAQRELAVKNKELQDITIILSKKDKEISSLKKELEDANEDATKMRKYAKTLETESSNKKENVETILGRVKDLTCSTLKIQCDSLMDWEASLSKAIISSTNEHINFLRAVQGQRVLFMPHSPGVYIALVLKQIQDIEADQVECISPFKQKDTNQPGMSSASSVAGKSESGASVKKQIVKNNLFLDINSLSKNLQTILNSYQMIVIARIKSVTKHQVGKFSQNEEDDDENNPFGLDEQEMFFKCQIEKLEHIVGFEGDEYSFTDYACR